ncbi:MAG: hypothetical protein IJC14_05490 [Firmicutes bacterium]|nr:hypothetical protein [Bacillota bacterium]
MSIPLLMCMLGSGYLVGYFARKKGIEIKGVITAQMTAVVVLLVIMGARICADEQVMASMASIGVSSVILTVFVFSGSIFAVTIFRKILGINREGDRK